MYVSLWNAWWTGPGGVIGLSDDNLFGPMLPLQGHPQGLHLPVLVLNGDELPLLALPPGRRRAERAGPGTKISYESNRPSERDECQN